MRDLRSDQYALFFIVLLILWTFFIIFNFVLFFKNKNSIYIRNRDPWLIFCSALGQYAMMVSLILKIILLRDKFPNMLDHWFIWGFIPLHLCPYPVRSMRFIIQYAYNRYQYKMLKSNGTEKRNPVLDFLQRHPILRQDLAYFILNWILMAILIAWGTYRNVKLPINHPGQYGYKNTSTYYYSCIALLVIASFFLWIAVFFLMKTSEELYITAELITIGILWIIFISLYIGFAWKDIGTFRLSSIFLIILCISSFCVSFGMPVQLAVVVKKYDYEEDLEQGKSENNIQSIDINNDENQFNSRNSINVAPKTENKSSNVDVLNKYKTLKAVMDDPESYELLVEFCQNKMCIEYILFYKDVSIYESLSDEELPEKFEEIKDKYVKDDAPFHINILVSVLRKVENTTEPDKKTFNEMKSKVDYLVKVEVFPPFKRSAPFKKFLDRKIEEANNLQPNEA